MGPRKSITTLILTIFISVSLTSLTAEKETIANSGSFLKTPLFQEAHLTTIGETNSGRVTAADINGDGILDIVAGFQWFEGPVWSRHRYARVEMGTKIDAGGAYPIDLDSDGDTDLVMQRRRSDGGRELIWLENPDLSHDVIWNRHKISDQVSCIEVIEFADIDDDGKIEMITVDDCTEPGLLIYEIPSNPAAQKWPTRMICKSRLHGLGIGDLNDDGRLDIVSDYQWFENKPNRTWIRRHLPPHHAHLSPGNRKNRSKMNMQILVYDIDEDGDNDILATQAHDYGAYWFESSGGTSPSFTRHIILLAPSQLHGVAYGDIDNDGDLDVFTGKSRYTHGDPGERDFLDVFWLELYRNAHNVKWIKHSLSSSLVMGFGPLAQDIDGDGDVDLVMRGLSFGNPPQFDVTIFLNTSDSNKYRKR